MTVYEVYIFQVILNDIIANLYFHLKASYKSSPVTNLSHFLYNNFNGKRLKSFHTFLYCTSRFYEIRAGMGRGFRHVITYKQFQGTSWKETLTALYIGPPPALSL